MRARLATPADTGAIAAIYNEGIAERVATFDTQPRTEEDIRGWFDGAHPIVVVEGEDEAVMGFAASSTYRPRECYAGVAEFRVYVKREMRGRGAGKLALEQLVDEARSTGLWKLLSRVFVENAASRALCRAAGFREVGTYYRHAKLDGQWRDVVIVEKFLAPMSPGAQTGRLGRDALLAALRSPQPGDRIQAVDALRVLIEDTGVTDEELLDAALDAFAAAKGHDPSARGRFVMLFRTYASQSPEGARDLWERLLGRVERWSVGADLAAFYELAFVVKQTIGLSGGRVRGHDLAAQRGRLIGWLKDAIALPPDLRGRISPANLSTLLLSLAVMASESEEEKNEVMQLVPEAVARHRVDPPASIRPPPIPSVPPPLPKVEPAPKPRVGKGKRRREKKS